jgi:hypothetical protein
MFTTKHGGGGKDSFASTNPVSHCSILSNRKKKTEGKKTFQQTVHSNTTYFLTN